MALSAVNALYVLRSGSGVRYCMMCWAKAAHVAPGDMGELLTLGRTFIDGDDPKAEEGGICGRCGAVGLVVSAKERRSKRSKHRNA